MKLVYKTPLPSPVRVGDVVHFGEYDRRVEYFREPQSPSSEGKVTLAGLDGYIGEFYVSIIGAEWIEREDREWAGSVCPIDPDNFWIDDETGERVCSHTGQRMKQPQPKENTMNTVVQTAALSALDAFINAVTAPLIARIEALENKQDDTDDLIDKAIEAATNNENLKNIVEKLVDEIDLDDKVAYIIRNRIEFTVEAR